MERLCRHIPDRYEHLVRHVGGYSNRARGERARAQKGQDVPANVPSLCAALPSVQGHIKSGAVRAIGVLTAQRTPAAPEIPTFAEQGLANFAVEAWFAVIGPKGMSPALVKKVGLEPQ